MNAHTKIFSYLCFYINYQIQISQHFNNQNYNEDILIALLIFVLCAQAQQNYSFPCNVAGCSICSYVNFCGQCQSNYFLNVNQTTGYTYCQQFKCNVSNCAKCAPNYQCQSCNQGYYLNIQGNCEEGQSTIQCGSSCLACSTAIACSICQYGYTLLQNGICIPNIPRYNYGCLLYSNPSICQICSYGQILSIEYSCQRQEFQNFSCTIPNCLLCSSTANCSICEPGYLLENQSACTKIICTVSNCLSCPNSPSQCQTCNPGFSQINGGCAILTQGCNVPNCKYCQSSTRCQICQSGYIVSQNQLCEAITNQSCLLEGYLTPQMIGFNGYQQGCLKCASSYLNVFGSCVPKLQIIMCNVPNCQYCVADNYCGMCNQGYWLAKGSTTQCWVSIKSFHNCAQYYFYNNPLQCQRCDNGYQIIQGACVSLSQIPLCNLIGCQYCYFSNQCESCYPGYVLNSQSQCILTNCIQNCLSCEESNVCNECLPGFLANSSGSCISELTQLTTSQCQSRYNSKCGSCNYLQCLSCQAGYVFADQPSLCCPVHDQNIYGCLVYHYQYYGYQNCQNYCAQFEPGFVSISGIPFTITCTIPNCNYCFKSSTCLVCSSGYNLNAQGQCLAFQKPSCHIFQCMACNSTGQCTQCVSGYLLFNGICVCDFQNCVNCLGGVFCTECANQMVPNFVFNDGGCSPPAYPEMLCNVQNCFFCTSQNFCSVCDIGYTLSNGTCTRLTCNASSNCQVCFGTQQFCWSCKSGYTQKSLLDPQCLAIPSNYSCEVENCVYCSSPQICSSCIEMYALTTTGSCVKAQCTANCYVCLFNNTCLVCQAGYYLNTNALCQQYSQQTPIPSCDSIINCKICSYRQEAISRLGCDVCVPGFEPSVNGYSCNLQTCGVKNCQFCVPTQSLVCAICEQGYFVNSYFQCQQYSPPINTVVACSVKNCLSCSSSNYCTSCLPGWNPIEGVCSNNHVCSISNCIFCISTNSCIACAEDYCLSGAGEGNQCVTCEEPQPQSSSNLGLILGICIPLAVIIIVLLIYLIYLKSRNNKQFLLYSNNSRTETKSAKQNLQLGGVVGNRQLQ